MILGSERQFAQQRGARAVRVLALEPFNQFGRGGGDGACLPTILPGFGDQARKSVLAIAARPLQHGFRTHRAAAGMRDVILARGDLLSASGEFAARQGFQDQRRDDAITEEGDFFGFVLHDCFRSMPKPTAEGGGRSRQMVCGDPQAGALEGDNVARRPSGDRERGQPSR